MNLSMNERAATLVDALVADADALGIEVRTPGLGRATGGLRRPGPRRAAGRPGVRGRLHGRPGQDRSGRR